MNPRQSPASLYIRAALDAAGYGDVLVQDDPATDGIFVAGGRVVLVGKMSGGWLTDETSHGGIRIDRQIFAELSKMLPYEPHGARASRHHEWRSKNSPPICRCPMVGDSAVLRGRRYTIVAIATHLNGDISWIRLVNPAAKRVSPRSITLWEWANVWKSHERQKKSPSRD